MGLIAYRRARKYAPLRTRLTFLLLLSLGIFGIVQVVIDFVVVC